MKHKKKRKGENVKEEESTRKDSDEIALPGSKIVASNYNQLALDKNDIHGKEQQRKVWNEYVDHHVNWIKNDAKAAASGGDDVLSSSPMISDADRRWLKAFDR